MRYLMKWIFIGFISLLSHLSVASELNFFEKKIRPILVNECYKCHSEGKKIKGSLRLDWKGGWLSGGDSGQAIIPGQAGKSLLIQAIRHLDSDLAMPPKKKLSSQQIKDLEKWVADGAYDPRTSDKISNNDKRLNIEAARRYWSFQPIKDYPTPKVKNKNWSKNSIDKFTLAEHEKRKLIHSDDADDITLLRRIYYNLTGLPPQDREIQKFLERVSVDRDNTITSTIDELLSRDDFGIRWGRHWLDIARYADSTGGGRTLLLNEAWRYRDYVIKSLNNDKPYDLFIKEQIAGDLLESSNPEQREERLISTAFLLLGPTNYELQDKTILEMDIIDEQLDTIGKSFMGLTLGCARCHDHKFDPITTEDYYGLAGILKSTKSVIHSNVSTWNKRSLPLSKKQEENAKIIRTKIQKIQNEIKTLKLELPNTKNLSKKSKNLLGLIIDNEKAVKKGNWIKSTAVKGFIDENYIHDDSMDKGNKTVTYNIKAPDTGRYEIRASYTHGTNRETKTPYTVNHTNGESTVIINQTLQPPINGSFVSLGVYEFNKDIEFEVVISNKNTTAVVIADSIQVIREGKSREKIKDDSNQKINISKINEKINLLETELKDLQKKEPKKIQVIAAEDHKKPGDINIALRGNVHSKGDRTPRQFIEVMTYEETPKFNQKSSGRIQLANWIASKHNPLTARVIVNRVWFHLFGEGIVSSLDNFGHMGTPPSNLKLLDHLAIKFINNSWSIKTLIRDIMQSRTYQLSSTTNNESEKIDPENTFLWKQNQRRLEAEAIRDSILFVSGSLDKDKGGAAIKSGTKTEYGYSFNSKKRSIYYPVFRNTLPEIMQVFDFADPNMVTGKRTTSSVPTQALYMLNNPFVIEESKKSAERLIKEKLVNKSLEIEMAYRRVLSRNPTDKEKQILYNFLELENESIEAWASIFHSLFSSFEFRHTN